MIILLPNCKLGVVKLLNKSLLPNKNNLLFSPFWFIGGAEIGVDTITMWIFFRITLWWLSFVSKRFARCRWHC